MMKFDKIINNLNEELNLHKIDLKPHKIGSTSDKEIETSGRLQFETGKDWVKYIKNKFPEARIEYVKDDTMMLTKDAPYMLQATGNGKVVAKYRGSGIMGRPDITT